MEFDNLDDYLREYGALLGKRAEESLTPLHNPAVDTAQIDGLLRKPYPAQAHVATAAVKALNRQKSVMIIAEPGSGKTLVSIATIHHRQQGKPYRVLVFCPGQLVKKWQREIEETLKNVTVTQLETWVDVVKLKRGKPSGNEWYVIPRDRAKLDSGWKGSTVDRRGLATCPRCGMVVLKKDQLTISVDDLERKRQTCDIVLNHNREMVSGCGEELWQAIPKPRRFAPCTYIHKHLRNFFDYLILDECFPGKTLVATEDGTIPISEVRVGMKVKTVKDGKIVLRSVVRTIKKKLTQKLVEINHERGVLVCPPLPTRNTSIFPTTITRSHRRDCNVLMMTANTTEFTPSWFHSVGDFKNRSQFFHQQPKFFDPIRHVGIVRIGQVIIGHVLGPCFEQCLNVVVHLGGEGDEFGVVSSISMSERHSNYSFLRCGDGDITIVVHWCFLWNY